MALYMFLDDKITFLILSGFVFISFPDGGVFPATPCIYFLDGIIKVEALNSLKKNRI